MFRFPLTWSYIQCIDSIWTGSFHNADTCNWDQHLTLCWSNKPFKSFLWAFFHFGGSIFKFILVFSLLETNDEGLIPTSFIMWKSSYIDCYSFLVFVFQLFCNKTRLATLAIWMLNSKTLSVYLFKKFVKTLLKYISVD